MPETRRPKPPTIPTPVRHNSTEASAKDLIRCIVAAAGGRFEGKTRLYKAFYAAHLFYYKSQRDYLTHHPIVHMPNGPGIDDGDRLLDELANEGVLSCEIDRRGLYPECIFELHQPLQVHPDDPRYEAIHNAIEWVRTKTGAELGALAHEMSRSWQHTNNDQEMNVYLDLLTDEKIERREAVLRETDGIVSAAFDR